MILLRFFSRISRGLLIGSLAGVADLVWLSGKYEGHLGDAEFLHYYAGFILPFALVGGLLDFFRPRRSRVASVEPDAGEFAP